MTFGEAQTKTRRRLNESSTVFFSDQDIKDALNEGYAEMADASEFYERQAMVPMIEGHTYYDLSLGLPDTFLSPRRAYNPTTAKWLTPTDPRDLDYHRYTQWELMTGEPDMYLMRGNWWFGVSPKPSRDSVGMRLYYTAIPEPLSATTDEPLFPQEFHDGTVAFALSDLLAQMKETEKALKYWQIYKQYETALVDYVNGRTSVARLVTL